MVIRNGRIGSHSVVATFNQEKALVGAFSVLVKDSWTFVSSIIMNWVNIIQVSSQSDSVDSVREQLIWYFMSGFCPIENI